MPSVFCSESHAHHLPGMAKTRSMSRAAAPWSDLDHDLLLFVMMELGVIDFLAFSGVCKSWRSLALDHRKRFMKSRLPMHIFFSDRAYKKTCYLQDLEGRMFKTILPHCASRIYVGVTCGYVILFGGKTHDFWLVNPITRGTLHFPNVSFCVDTCRVRAILVYSPSLSASVFVMVNQFSHELWFSIEGKGAWNKVSSCSCLIDLHAFKGKIYTLHTIAFHLWHLDRICELTLVPEPKFRIVGRKKLTIPGLKWELTSSDENLYLVHFMSGLECKVYELDTGKKKLLTHERTTSEYAFFLSSFKSSAGVKPSGWADSCSSKFVAIHSRGKFWLNLENMWYFPHDCLSVKDLDV